MSFNGGRRRRADLSPLFLSNQQRTSPVSRSRTIWMTSRRESTSSRSRIVGFSMEKVRSSLSHVASLLLLPSLRLEAHTDAALRCSSPLSSTIPHFSSLSIHLYTEDELMNVDLAGHEDDEKNVELKRKRKEYSGYDDDEFDPSMLGMKKKVLSKYDVDLEGGAGEELVSFNSSFSLLASYFTRRFEADPVFPLSGPFFIQGFRLGGSVAPKKKKSDRAGLGEDEEMEGNVNRTLLEGGLSYESESSFAIVLLVCKLSN